MKITHLLVLGLIAFIVFRLTQSVQDPPPPSPEPGRTEYIQTTEAPARSPDRDSENRKSADSPLKTILQRLVAPAPTPAPATMPRPPVAPESIPSQPGPPTTAAVATPVPLSPREQLRLSEARRPALEREYGSPKYYRGFLRQHMPDGTVLVEAIDAGFCRVEDYQDAQRMPDGAPVSFDAWSTGARIYADPDGRQRSALYLIHAGPALPLWDNYGRPINRDVLPPETIRKAGIHTETMLDRKPR